MERLFFIIILFFIITLNLDAQFSGGSGTIDAPYIITTWKELENIGNASNSSQCYKLANDLDYDNPEHYGGYVRPSTGWKPLCESPNPFTGTFDGNNKTIKNIKMEYSNIFANIGLFASISGGIIKNIKMEGGEIIYSGKSDTYGRGAAVGSIVGAATNGEITNCESSLHIKTSGSIGGVGGICGNGSVTINDCINKGNISSPLATPVGGIVASCNTVNRCINWGNISSTTSNNFVGGIVGEAGTVFSCINYGDIEADVNINQSRGIGGIAGNAGNIISCTNHGNVRNNGICGGIMGGCSTCAESNIISSCANTGSVTGRLAGGIAGYVGYTMPGNTSNSIIVKCVNTGHVSTTSTTTSRSSGGGIVGYHQNAGTISACINMGDISSNIVSTLAAFHGGIVGQCMNSVAIRDCYNSGTINNANGYSGGIVGQSYFTYITTCYNTGEIQSGTQMGAIAGTQENNSYTINCYYLDLSWDKNNRPPGAGGFELKYSEMCKKESYVNFDFRNTWEMRKGIPFPQPIGTELNYVSKVITNPNPIYISRNENPSITTTVEPTSFNPDNTYLYTISDDENVATVNKDGSIIFHSSGRTTLTVFSPHGGFSNKSDDLFKTRVTLNLSVPNKTYGDPSFVINATSSPQPIHILYTSSDPSILSISGNMATIHKAGQVTVAAKVAEDDPDYTSDAVQQTITISPATITVTANSGSSVYGETPANPGISASGLKYGEAVDILTGLSNSFGIDASTPAGTYTLTVEGTLTNGNYQINQRINGSWTVTKTSIPSADIVWPSASPINYGQALSESSLTGGSAPVSGLFEFKHSSLIPPVGINQQIVVFIPSNANYTQPEGLVYVTVNNNIPESIVWPSASPIHYGQTLSESSLTGGSAPVSGIFEFKYPSLIPPVGTNRQVVVFIPSDANYTQVEGWADVTVYDEIAGSEDAFLLSLLVDGEPIDLIPGQTLYHYTAKCGAAAVGIAVIASEGATVTINGNPGFTFNLNTPEAGEYTVTIIVTAPAGNQTTYTLLISRPFDGNVVIQRWDDVLAAVNNPDNNGGYTFTSYQWYKNNRLLPGETGGYMRESGGLDVSSEYHVMLTTTTGIHAPSCPYTPKANNKSYSLKVFPNPARSNQVFRIELLMPEDELPDAVLTLYNFQGRPVNKMKAVQGSNTIAAPAGFYVLSLTVGNIEVASTKIVIE